MIKIYSQPGWLACQRATEYLSQKNMKYQEINIRTTAGAIDELVKLGVRATPALIIGDKVLVGFDPGEIDRAVAVQDEQ